MFFNVNLCSLVLSTINRVKILSATRDYEVILTNGSRSVTTFFFYGEAAEAEDIYYAFLRKQVEKNKCDAVIVCNGPSNVRLQTA